jgi:hypothetical protein
MLVACRVRGVMAIGRHTASAGSEIEVRNLVVERSCSVGIKLQTFTHPVPVSDRDHVGLVVYAPPTICVLIDHSRIRRRG